MAIAPEFKHQSLERSFCQDNYDEYDIIDDAEIEKSKDQASKEVELFNHRFQIHFKTSLLRTTKSASYFPDIFTQVFHAHAKIDADTEYNAHIDYSRFCLKQPESRNYSNEKPTLDIIVRNFFALCYPQCTDTVVSAALDRINERLKECAIKRESIEKHTQIKLSNIYSAEPYVLAEFKNPVSVSPPPALRDRPPFTDGVYLSKTDLYVADKTYTCEFPATLDHQNLKSQVIALTALTENKRTEKRFNAIFKLPPSLEILRECVIELNKHVNVASMEFALSDHPQAGERFCCVALKQHGQFLKCLRVVPKNLTFQCNDEYFEKYHASIFESGATFKHRQLIFFGHKEILPGATKTETREVEVTESDRGERAFIGALVGFVIAGSAGMIVGAAAGAGTGETTTGTKTRTYYNTEPAFRWQRLK